MLAYHIIMFVNPTKRKKQGGHKMKFETIMAIVIWVVAIIGIIVMKKLQSGGKLYPAWAIFVATLYSIYAWLS